MLLNSLTILIHGGKMLVEDLVSVNIETDVLRINAQLAILNDLDVNLDFKISVIRGDRDGTLENIPVDVIDLQHRGGEVAARESSDSVRSSLLEQRMAISFIVCLKRNRFAVNQVNGHCQNGILVEGKSVVVGKTFTYKTLGDRALQVQLGVAELVIRCIIKSFHVFLTIFQACEVDIFNLKVVFLYPKFVMLTEHVVIGIRIGIWFVLAAVDVNG